MKVDDSLPTETNLKKSYILSPEVYLISLGDNTYLLDLQRGKFYGLNPTAYLMLSSILAKGVKKTISEITQTYAVIPEQAQRDCQSLLHDLENKHLLNGENISPIFLSPILKTCIRKIGTLLNPSPEPNYLIVNLLLLLSYLSFRLLGWKRTLLLWQQWHTEDKRASLEDITPILEKVDRLVREAAATQLFFPPVCRERALVGYHLLHVYYGIGAELVVGWNPYPFQVHTWVEYQGKVITDDLEHCQMFTEVTRYP